MTLPSIKEKIIGSFIGAAVGDALGWPYEDRSGRVDRESHVSSNGFGNEFVSWTRRCGSRFQAFEEPISAGDYSDDTQLILSTTRSLWCGEDWWNCFTQIELPLWLTYQRGGGRATKRAAQLWLTSTAPWASPKESVRYFEAGGNGVCMRLLPHVIRNLGRNEFSPIASEIILNGICTHGHPRALVGGLAHGYALWLAFRQHDVLSYGALIREVIEQASVWSELRGAASDQTGWRQSFSNEDLDAYQASWVRSVKEMVDLLKIAHAAMELGALSTGYETLEKMGAFDRGVNGSGTITAAASIFLASRYAVSPLQGIRVAATARGADTDTLASMTASLLGALGGEEWLSSLREQVQDSKYLQKLASSLTLEDKSPSASNRSVHRVSKTATSALLTTLEKSQPTSQAMLPDGRQVLVAAVEQLNSRSKNWEARRWRLETDDGQTLFICKLRRKLASKPGSTLAQRDLYNPGVGPIEVVRVGIKIFVCDLEEAKRFYISTLGLTIDKETASSFTASGTLSVYRVQTKRQGVQDLRNDGWSPPLLCLKVKNIEEVCQQLQTIGVRIAEHLSRQHNYRYFRVTDPSGNIIELFEGLVPT